MWIFGLGTLAACNPEPESEAHAACTALCECVAPPLHGPQQECFGQCFGQLINQNTPQSCTQCVFEHANECSSVIADCVPLCNEVPPPNGDGGVVDL